MPPISFFLNITLSLSYCWALKSSDLTHLKDDIQVEKKVQKTWKYLENRAESRKFFSGQTLKQTKIQGDLWDFLFKHWTKIDSEHEWVKPLPYNFKSLLA